LEQVFGSETSMNKLIILIWLALVQTAGQTWGSSYFLHLKNGNELRTSYYWEEDDEIKFFIYGGIAGIQKGFVIKVTLSDWNYKEGQSRRENTEEIHPPLIPSSPKSKEMPAIQGGETESKSGKATGKDGVIGFDYYRERKASLKEKLDDALQRNREAIARKDQQAKDLTRKEYLEFSRQIIDLGDELKSKNKGLLPDWWEE
jgi:hypothetical protein